MRGNIPRSFNIASLLCGVALPVLSCAGAASAQATDPTQPANPASVSDASAKPVTTLNEIVITGTLIRGKAPTGGEITTINSAEIQQLGIVETSQLLGSLPQDAEFNNRPQVGSYGQYQSVNAPLLRYLGGNSSGSNSTLLLVDGVRLPGMGILQTSADIDAIAPGAIERVDVVPDGGSATYGADAVGGVVNLITRRRFDGLEVGAHYGVADDYNQYDFSATGGKTWDNSSLWFSYDYTHHDLIHNYSRDYFKDLNYTTTPYTGNSQTCNPGNFIAGGYVAISTPPYYALQTTTYPIVNGVPVSGAANTCQLSRAATFFPAEDRHALTMGFDDDLTNWLAFDLRAYYMHRDAMNDGGPNYYAGVPATACVYGAAICAQYGNPQSSGTVSGNFSPSLGDHTYTKSTLDTWAIIPKLTAKLPGDWQLVAFLNVGEGDAKFSGQNVGGDATALASEAASGAFNPFTGTFASTAAGQAAQNYQANYYGYSSGKDEITNVRGVFDGPLFSLPGGQVRAAFGAEFMHEKFTQVNGTAELADLGSLPSHPVSRSVSSGFAELSIPIVGESNRMPGFYSVTFSAAGRYDNYSDFGGTFDPKFALSWNPISWWTLRGNWGNSFQAPSLASTAAAIPPGVVAVPASTFGGNPAYPNTSGLTILLLYPGGGVNLQPQKATTWEVGTDIKPTFLPGFTASATYYNIAFSNRIGEPEFYSASFYSLYPNSFIMNSPSAPLTTAEIQKYIGSAYNAAQVAQYVNNPGTVYALENGLSQNLSSTTTSGIDFSLNYQRPMSFGTVFAGVGGTYILTYSSQATPTSAPQGLDANNVSRIRMSTTFGAKVGDLLAKLTWNLTGSYEIPSTAGDAFQSQVGSFSTVNLAFVYAPKYTGPLAGMTYTLNVDNLLDSDPPVYNGTNGAAHGYAGFTLGRFIELGLKKKF